MIELNSRGTERHLTLYIMYSDSVVIPMKLSTSTRLPDVSVSSATLIRQCHKALCSSTSSLYSFRRFLVLNRVSSHSQPRAMTEAVVERRRERGSSTFRIVCCLLHLLQTALEVPHDINDTCAEISI